MSRIYSLKKKQVFFRVSSLEGILFLLILMVIPRETNTEYFLGYSLSRLIMMSLILLISIGFGSMIVWEKHFSNFSQKIICVSNQAIWLFTTFFSIIFFFLLHWFFIGSENHLYSYLERLTPFLGYGGLISIQVILLLIFQKKENKHMWQWLEFFLSTFFLLSVLFIIEYIFVDNLFIQKHLAKKYAQDLLLGFSLSLSLTVLFIQFFIKAHQHHFWRNINLKWTVALMFIILGYFYYNATSLYAETVNTSLTHSDQSAYVQFSKTVYDTNYSFTGRRNRMPIYPSLQAMFYQQGMSDDSFFTQGKQINIILSFICLSALFFIFRRYLSLHRSTILTFIVTIGIFLFRSPHFTSEILYYFFSFLGFLSMGHMLKKSSLHLGAITGFLLAIAFLTKASNLPAIIAFTFVFVLKGLFIYRGNREKKQFFSQIASLGVTLGVFILFISPYLQENKTKYGHYFYNINTTFYIWHDTYDEAIHDENLKGHLDYWPNTPAEQLPSLKNYIRDHTWKQATDRLFAGFKAQVIYLAKPDTKFNYLFIYTGALLFLLISLERGTLKKVITEYWELVLFFFLSFGGYLLLYGWYYPIGSGGRFIYSIFMPVIFFLFLATDKLAKNNDSQKLIFNLHRLQLYEIIVFSALIFDFYYSTSIVLPNGYYGS